MNDARTDAGGWAWWEARRLRYNLALGAAGLAAYGSTVALFAAFGRPMWAGGWAGAAGVTLALGTAFLVVMFAANICFLIGPALEAWMRPAEPERYRRRAFALGLWSSVALPFAFPLMTLAMLIARAS